MEKERFKAMINRDSVFLSRILADDLIYTHSDGETDSKSSFIKSIISGELVYYSIQLKKINVIIKNKTAWISGLADVKVKPASNKDVLHISISYLDVYYQRKDQWQLEAWQSAKIK